MIRRRAAKAVLGDRRGGDVDPDGGEIGDAPIGLQFDSDVVGNGLR